MYVIFILNCHIAFFYNLKVDFAWLKKKIVTLEVYVVLLHIFCPSVLKIVHNFTQIVHRKKDFEV